MLTEVLEYVFIILCWLLLFAELVVVGLKRYATARYPGSLQQVVDKVAGVHRIWPITSNVIVIAITAAFLYWYHTMPS